MSIITQPTDESKEAMQAKYQAVPPKTRSGGGGGDLPSGGTEGQVLIMGATDPEWGSIDTAIPAISISINGKIPNPSVGLTATSMNITDPNNVIDTLKAGERIPCYVSILNARDSMVLQGLGIYRKHPTDSHQAYVYLYNEPYGSGTYNSAFTATCTITESNDEYSVSVKTINTNLISGIADTSATMTASALPAVGNSETITGALDGRIPGGQFDALRSPIGEKHFPFYMTWNITAGSTPVVAAGLSSVKFTCTDETTSVVAGTLAIQTIAVIETGLYVIDASLSRSAQGIVTISSATIKRLV